MITSETMESEWISSKACTAYGVRAYQEQDKNHEYETVSLRDFPPLPPIPTSDLSSPVQENEVNSSQNGSNLIHSDTPSVPTTLHTAGRKFENDERCGKPTRISSSGTIPNGTSALRTAATPTDTTPTSITSAIMLPSNSE